MVRMVWNVGALLVGALLLWLGMRSGAAVAILAAAVSLMAGIVWSIADAWEWLRERAYVRRAAARNRLHWGKTEPAERAQ